MQDSDSSSWLLYRLDSSGNVLWGSYTGFYDAPTDMAELADGTFVLVGTFNRIYHLTSAGAVLWGQERGGWAHPSLAIAQDGDILVAGGWADFSLFFASWYTADHEIGLGNAFFVTRLAPDGSVRWSHFYRSDAPELSTGICATPDNGCVVVGETKALGPNGGDLRVMKLDTGGAVEWQKFYGDAAREMAFDVSRSANGDLLVAGRRETGPGSWEGMLLRLDSSGGLGACSPVDAVLLAEDINLFDSAQFLGLEVDHFVADGTTWQDVAIQHSDFCPSPVQGASYCGPANLNSSGRSAVIWAKGSDQVAQNDLYLFAAQMPRSRFGYFLAGMGSGTMVPPGSQGNLCLLGSQIHRYAKSVASTGPGGAFGLTIDLTAIPGHGAALSGETWNFQAWFRDANPNSTSNFTDALTVTLQ